MKPTTPTSRILCVFFATASAGLAFGQTWIPTGAPSNSWSAVACSADGSKVVAATTGNSPTGQIFISNDGGTNWTPTGAPLEGWTLVTSSADGTRLAALAAVAKFGAYTSTDSGAAWVWHKGPPYAYGTLDCSADGSTLLGVEVDYNVYLSPDFGDTWVKRRTPIFDINTAAFSTDGTTIVAMSNGGEIASSTNAGATWSQPVGPGSSGTWVAGSADLRRLICLTSTLPYPAVGQSILTSTDMGQTWVTNPVPAVDWLAAAASADGTKFVVGSGCGLIYSSSDSGTTWTSNSAPALHWYRNCLASSADGNTVFAAASAGGVWVRRTTPAPVLRAGAVRSGLKLSWLVPSATFQLQQTPSLGAPVWSDVTNLPALNLTNLNHEVFLPQPPANVFFRLVQR